MPPRLPIRTLAALSKPKTNSIPSTTSSIPTFLVPFLTTQIPYRPTARSTSVSQIRSASILSDLRNVPSSYGTRIRVGRGPSSRKGGKSGRGHKGQKQKGKVPFQFSGGQTPDHIVHGHYGFKNTVHGLEYQKVNLDKIQEWINLGRLDPAKPITLHELCKSRVVGGVKDGVKLLGRGAPELKEPIHIVVSRASKSAIAAIEALGGSVTTRFYTRLAIRRIKNSQMHPYVSFKWDQDAIGKSALMLDGAATKEERVTGLGFEYRLPDPTGRKDLEYYRDKQNRGYLAHTVKEGHSPSLYYQTPLQKEEKAKAREAATGVAVATEKAAQLPNKMF